MKTILQILPSLDKIDGGVERGTLDIAKTIAEQGYKSAIISSGGEMAEKYKYKGVSHYTLNISRKGLMNFFYVTSKIKNLLDEIKPSIVHIRSRWPAFCFSSEIKKRHIPLVTTYHGTYSGNNFLPKKRYNKVMTNGDRVITISKFIDDHIRFFFPESKNRLVQINRGIDTTYFDLSSVTQVRKENFLSNISISENTHIILLPARITSWKGHLVAVEAAKMINTIKPDLNFSMIFVGSGESKKNYLRILKKRIERLKLQNKIYFCGHLSDMPAVYSIADVILSTSIEPEAFGRVSAEASSMTKPIIASNHGGSREIIENNITGWLVEPRDPKKLAEKILYVLGLSEKEKDLVGRNARRRVKEKFSLNDMLTKTMAVYEELIARKENISN